MLLVPLPVLHAVPGSVDAGIWWMDLCQGECAMTINDIHACVHINTHNMYTVYVHTYIYIYIHTYIHIYIYGIHIYIYGAHIYIYIILYVCTKYVYIYICTHLRMFQGLCWGWYPALEDPAGRRDTSASQMCWNPAQLTLRWKIWKVELQLASAVAICLRFGCWVFPDVSWKRLELAD